MDEEITSIFPVVPLGRVSKVKSGFAFKSKDWKEAGVPVIKIANVKEGRLVMDGCSFVDEEVAQSASMFELQPGDILIAMTGYIGEVARVRDEGRCLLNQRVGRFAILDQKALDADFLFFWLAHADTKAVMSHLGHGSAQPNVSPSLIEAVELPLPPLPEQRAIAAVLGGLDDKIELNRRMNRTLEDLARGLFRSWFVDFDPVIKGASATAPAAPNPRVASPGGGLPIAQPLWPKRLIDSPLGPIPEGWRVGRLGDWCRVNAYCITKEPREGEFSYIDISSVSRGTLDGPRRVAWKDAPSRAQRLVKHGDTLWSCVRPNLEAYMLSHRPSSDWVASTGFAALTPNVGARSFVFLATTQPEFIDYLVARAEGSAYPAVRPDAFADAPMIAPPQSIMARFESIVGPWMERCGENREESKRLAALRDALLPQLLSGEIRLREAQRTIDDSLQANGQPLRAAQRAAARVKGSE